MNNLKSYLCFRILKKILFTLVLTIVVFFLLVVLRLYNLKRSNPKNPIFTIGNLEMHMLDVGQGDSFIFLQNNKVLVVDAGDIYNWNVTNNALKELGVKKIDYLIVTHPHQDHIGGLFSIFMNYKVEKLITPYINPKDVSAKKFAFHSYNFGINIANFIYDDKLVSYAREDGKYKDFSFEDSEIEFLGPEDESYDIFNNYSLIFKVKYGEVSILMTGDMEYEVEEQLLMSGKDISATIYKAAHHGSSTSNESTFLESVNPEYVLISAENGNHNNFGHPVKRFMRYLEKNNISVYRTDEAGDIKIITDGTKVRFYSTLCCYKSGTEFLKEKED